MVSSAGFKKIFPLAAHIWVNITPVRKTGHFDNHIKAQYWVNFK